jgi:hypothetical protein
VPLSQTTQWLSPSDAAMAGWRGGGRIKLRRARRGPFRGRPASGREDAFRWQVCRKPQCVPLPQGLGQIRANCWS